MDRKSNRTPALFCLIVVLVLSFLSLNPSTSLAKKVTLGWDSNSEPDLEGYVVYRNVGSPGPPYKYADTLPEDDLADPLNPSVTLTGLNEKTQYYIAVTAYDTEGNESNFSSALCFEIEDSAIQNCSASLSTGTSSSNSGSSGGGSGGGCFITAANLNTPYPISGPFLLSHSPEILLAVLFMLLISAVRSVSRSIR